MSKRLRNILIIAMALLIMFIANVILYSSAQNDEIKEDNSEYIYISNYSVGSVTKVQIENEHGLLTLLNDEGIWTAQGYEGVELDQELVAEIMYMLTHIAADRQVSDKEDDADLYGMLSPKGRITTYHEGVLEQTFVIGDKAPLENQYYMQSSVFKKVFIVDMAYYIYSQIKLEDLMLLKGIDTDHGDMRKIKVRNSKGEAFTIQRTAHNNDVSLCYWEFIEPFNHDADTGVLYGTDEYDGMITYITELTADRVIQFGNSDAQAYGLDNPLFTAEIYKDTGIAQSFSIGDFGDEDDYSLVFDNSNVIYSIAKDRVPFINYSAFMLSDAHLSLINLDAVSKVSIDLPELNIIMSADYIELENDDQMDMEVTGVDKGATASLNIQEQMIWFYEDLAAIAIDDLIDGYESGDKIGSFYFELHSEYIDSYLVEFYEYSISHYLAKKNNEDMGYLVNKKEIDKLIKSYELLKEGRLNQNN